MSRSHRPETRARRDATDLLELFPLEMRSKLLEQNEKYYSQHRAKRSLRNDAHYARVVLIVRSVFHPQTSAPIAPTDEEIQRARMCWKPLDAWKFVYMSKDAEISARINPGESAREQWARFIEGVRNGRIRYNVRYL